MSADSLAHDFHCILESLDALRQAVDDLILLVETFIHLVFELLSQTHELCHCVPLELFNVFVLFLQLAVGVVFEGAELKRFVGALVVNLFLQVVLAVVHFLEDILLSLDARLHLSVKLRLQAYAKMSQQLIICCTYDSKCPESG